MAPDITIMRRWLHIELFEIAGSSVTVLSLFTFVCALVAAVVLSSLLRRVVERSLARKVGTSHQGAAYAVGRISQYVVLVTGGLLALDNLGISLTTLAAFGALLTVGIGFGLQNIAQNFISGVILLIERPVQKGDFVRIGDTVGTVQEIAMRATRVVSRDGISIIVPNSELVSGTVVNLTAPTPTYRLRIPVGVRYGSDTAEVSRVLLQVAASQASLLRTPAPQVFFTNFGDSSLDFELCVWLEDPQNEPRIASELRFAIDAAFREHGIDIPFPQRDVHVIGAASVEPALARRADAGRYP